jgi:hypothetical protein
MAAQGEWTGRTPISYRCRVATHVYNFALPDGRFLGDVPVDQVTEPMIGAVLDKGPCGRSRSRSRSRSRFGDVLGVLAHEVFEVCGGVRACKPTLPDEIGRTDAGGASLAMLAHELRNPLGPLRNALLLLMKHPKASAPTIADMWDVLDRQVGNLTRLVDDLLDVARVTRGQIEMRKAMVDLITIVRRAHHVDGPGRVRAAQGAGAVGASGRSPLCRSRRDAPGAGLGNLLHNASKFNAEGGHIWVTIEVEHGGDQSPDGRAVERIRDDGLGIDPAMLPRVFDLFAQVDQSLGRPRGWASA